MNYALNVTHFIILDTPNKIAENLTDFSNIAIALGHLNPGNLGRGDSHPVGSWHGGNQGIAQILTVRIEKIIDLRCFLL